MLKHVVLSKIEAEVIEHRLQFLADSDEEDLEELFDGKGMRIDYLRDFACSTAINLRDGLLIVALSSEESIAALVEAIEGATIQSMAGEAKDGKLISRQRAGAYAQALYSAAEKLSVLGERSVVVPGR